MGLLKRKELLKREKLEILKVDLGNDDYVFVRQMTGRERDQFERSLYEFVDTPDAKEKVKMERRLENFRAKLVVCCMCDENGDLLLEYGDIFTFSNSISAARLEKIVNVAQKLNAITEEDKEALVKNSDAGQAGNTSSDSVVS